MTASPPHACPDFAHLLRLIRKRAGLSFPKVRQNEVAAAIRRVMKKHVLGDIDQLAERLETDAQIFDAVMSEITVGETYFFRDSAQFEVIRNTVLPSLLRDRPSSSPIRIWSAGCSTGEEAYSLSILMEEEGLGERAQILATDISRRALKKAQGAEYGPWSLRDVPSRTSNRFFCRHGDRFRLPERFRQRVSFDFLNLASESYPSFANGTAGVDLILCRNVLIYFDSASVRRTANRLFDSLADGGWLVIGPSDPPLWDYAPFETVITLGGVLYRRRSASAVSEPGASKLPQREIHRSPTRLRQKAPASAVAADQQDLLRKAEAAYAASDHRRVIQLTDGIDQVIAHVLRIRSLADTGNLTEAEETAKAALARHESWPELHYLQGILFMARDRENEAIAALRRSIYLKPTLAAAYLALGSVLQRTDKTAALRAFTSARTLCAARPPDEIVPLSGGDAAGHLAEAAQEQIDRLSALMTAGS